MTQQNAQKQKYPTLLEFDTGTLDPDGTYIQVSNHRYDGAVADLIVEQAINGSKKIKVDANGIPREVENLIENMLPTESGFSDQVFQGIILGYAQQNGLQVIIVDENEIFLKGDEDDINDMENQRTWGNKFEYLPNTDEDVRIFIDQEIQLIGIETAETGKVVTRIRIPTIPPPPEPEI